MKTSAKYFHPVVGP